MGSKEINTFDECKKCDLCRSPNLELLYIPEGSLRDAHIHICTYCGLMQSKQSDDYKKLPRIASISSRANWGNIRHGKGLRMPCNLEFIKKHIKNRNGIKKILDIGSNRGDFMKSARRIFPKTDEILGIEPDQSIIDWDKSDKSQIVLVGRLENTVLKKSYFDFVFSSHTLEHAFSARAMLKKTYDLLRTGGIHFLEVPNIENISDANIVEEYFIDKHNFHFSRDILISFVRVMGFSVIAGFESKDKYNITLLLEKKETNNELIDKRLKSPIRINKQLRSINNYIHALKANRAKLRYIAHKIENIASHSRVVLFGGGRIFDALVEFGGLNPRKMSYVIDTYIGKYFSNVHGIKIVAPDEIDKNLPDCVIVLARSSSRDIYKYLEAKKIKKIIQFEDLMNREKNQLAESSN